MGPRGVAHLTEDVNWRAKEGAPDDHGPIHGKDAMGAYVQDWFDMFDDVRFEPMELIDAGGDQVVSVVHLTARARLSGVETRCSSWRPASGDGKMAAGREYASQQEALEAASLSE